MTKKRKQPWTIQGIKNPLARRTMCILCILPLFVLTFLLEGFKLFKELVLAMPDEFMGAWKGRT
jgi:hypothetical protein